MCVRVCACMPDCLSVNLTLPAVGCGVQDSVGGHLVSALGVCRAGARCPGPRSLITVGLDSGYLVCSQAGCLPSLETS